MADRLSAGGWQALGKGVGAARDAELIATGEASGRRCAAHGGKRWSEGAIWVDMASSGS